MQQLSKAEDKVVVKALASSIGWCFTNQYNPTQH